MKFNKIMMIMLLATSLAACKKDTGIPVSRAEEATAIPVPKGFKVLTTEDLRKDFLQKGMLPGEINLALANIKLSIRPEELGQTAAEINRKLKEPAPKANTENGAPNIMEAALVENNLIDADFALYPAVNSPNPWTGQQENYQYYAYSGNHWYWNQAPSGDTYGYSTHRQGNFFYFKDHNPIAGLYNCRYSSTAWFAWRPSNNACYHNVVLYYWNGATWVLIYNVLNFRNAANVFQTTSDISADWRFGSEYFLVGVGIQASGWNPPGWSPWRTQHVQFRMYW